MLCRPVQSVGGWRERSGPGPGRVKRNLLHVRQLGPPRTALIRPSVACARMDCCNGVLWSAQ
eukprot:645412-Amphidinium_carterae.3